MKLEIEHEDLQDMIAMMDYLPEDILIEHITGLLKEVFIQKNIKDVKKITLEIE